MILFLLMPCLPNRQFRAFSLIEAAIVLALIGLVIGGIYAALSSVQRNRKMSETISGVLTLASNVKKELPPSTYPSTGGVDFASAIFIKLGPDNWIDAANVRYVSPYGTPISIMLYAADSSPAPAVGAVQTFRIGFDLPSAGEANRLIQVLQNQAVKYGMVYAFCTQAGVSSPIDWAGYAPTGAKPQCLDYNNGVGVRLFFLP